MFQIRIAALNAASSAADESQDPLRSSKSRTKEAQVKKNNKKNEKQAHADESATLSPPTSGDLSLSMDDSRSAFYFRLQEAEAFALYHKALDLQKHDKFEESAKAYHELLKTPLLKEVSIK